MTEQSRKVPNVCFKCTQHHPLFDPLLNGIGNQTLMSEICGRSYKHFTIVIYNPRVVIWSVFKSGTTPES